MKKLLLTFAATLGLASAAAAIATSGGGTQTFEIGISTPSNTPVLVANGAGTLLNIQISSGTQGDFGVAWDTGTTFAAGSFTLSADGSALYPRIANIFISSTGFSPANLSGGSVAFKNGLLIRLSANDRAVITVSQ